jgi:hypothetical protein
MGRLVFSAFSGWSRRPDVADCRKKTEQLSRPAQMRAPGVGQWGEVSGIVIGQFATAAAQIAHRRHSARD